jgi:hypothetical protein
MERTRKEQELLEELRQSANDWTKLICKLRWIGLEDEARQLQLAVRTLAPEKRSSVSAGPFPTD